MITSPVNEDRFLSFFLTGIALISLPSLIAFARNFSMTLKSSGEWGHLWLSPDFSGKAARFSPLR